MEYIQLNKDNILRIGIKNQNGKKTDCVLEFDVEDIEWPLRINKCEFEHNKNLQSLKNQFAIIDKKEDRKSNGLLTWKQSQKIMAYKEFYEKDMKALDLVLGEGKTQEILNVMRRKPYYSMFEDIFALINPILPKLKKTTDDITNKIKQKYDKKEDNVLE